MPDPSPGHGRDHRPAPMTPGDQTTETGLSASEPRRSAIPSATATAGTGVAAAAPTGLGLRGGGGHPAGAGHEHDHFLRGGLELHLRGGGRSPNFGTDTESLRRAPGLQERARGEAAG